MGNTHSWYSSFCCSEKDCKPISSCSDLTYQQDGSVVYQTDKATYVFSKDRVLPSQDNKCHVCLYYDRPQCVYIQLGY